MQRKNKVSSPSTQSPSSSADKNTDIIELFSVKQATSSKPKPRKRKSIIVPPPSDSQDISELSDDVFVQPSSTDSVNKSESKSYRERINERYKEVQQKAGKSTKKANVFKETAERLILEKVRRESNVVDAEYQQAKNRFNLGPSTKSGDLYDFFCKERPWEIREEQHDEEIENSTTNLSTNNMEIKRAPADLLTFNVKISERDLLFKPSHKPIQTEDKIANDEPRYLEEEGLYIAKKPKLPPDHLNILESRLLSDNTKWFDCEGTLDFLESPIAKTSSRPCLGVSDSSETTFYLPATTCMDQCEEVVVIQENILQLRILNLIFLHHPLFSLEHVYEQKLIRLYEEHQRKKALNNFKRLNQKLAMMRQSQAKQDASGDSSSRGGKNRKNYARIMEQLREQVFKEGRNDRLRLKSILHTWKTLKEIRTRNNYSNTTVRLLIKKQNVDFETEKEEYDNQFETYLDDLIAEKETSCRHKQDIDKGIRRQLQEQFEECFKPPGEPILDFELNRDNVITKTIENAKEITRRKTVSTSKIFLRVICNKVEVCKTKSIELNNTFSCSFNECIDVQLISVPSSITVEINEQTKSLVKKILGEITLKVPRKSISAENTNTSEVTFEEKEIIHYKHEGVGSGMALKEVANINETDTEENDILNTSGRLTFTIGWHRPTLKEVVETEGCNTIEINKIINKNGSIDGGKLYDWLRINRPDPQDPKNFIFYEHALVDEEPSLNIVNKSSRSFRLNPYLKGFQFCTPDVLEENKRLKILQLRNRNEPEFDQMLVPNRIKEIPLNVLEDYHTRINTEFNLNIVEEDYDEDEIEKRRANGKKLLKQIHIKIFHMCKNTENNLTFEDVVNEKFLLHFQNLITNTTRKFINWFRWQPLKLFSIESPKTPTGLKSSNQPTAVVTKIKIKINSAMNVPSRSAARFVDKETEVKPFLEVQFNNITARSSTSSGANPLWNEELFLSLESSYVDYLNPNSLNGSILINLFDEYDTVLNKFGGNKAKQSLGYIELPLSSICYNGASGSFKMKTPYLLFGYEKPSDKNTPKKPNHQVEADTYVNLNVVLEPGIPKLTPSMEELLCNELPFIKDYALCWNKNYNTNFPDRKFSVFTIDTNAKTTCIVRYIKPIEPPQINMEGFDVTAKQCARYISLIPFTDCNHFYQNVWITVEQFLHLMIGSIMDHAVALTCYLLALKSEVWLLLGSGTTYGHTAFVLVREYRNNEMPLHYIYDVVYGERYNVTDPFCPLQKIYCVVNESNVWANIQRTDNVNITRYDFNRRSDWLPLFNNKNSPSTSSFQTKVTYLPVSEVGELEVTIDRKIRRKIARLRPLDRTTWNRHVSNTFKTVLGSFENNIMFAKSNTETLRKLKKFMSNYWVKGYVINLPFTTVSAIMKRIKCLGIHMQEESDIEFASAVHVKCYPNQVLSIWIFLACVGECDSLRTNSVFAVSAC